jgi:hypothetical protein
MRSMKKGCRLVGHKGLQQAAAVAVVAAAALLLILVS